MANNSSCVILALKRLNLGSKLPQLTLKRNTVVFERRHPVPLVPMDKPLNNRKLKERHFVYDVVRNTDHKPIPDIQCILTTHVDGIGSEGELVTVKRRQFRRVLYPTGAAVYASPENIEHYQKVAPKIKRTRHALQTYRTLCAMNLKIPMNIHRKWTLTQEHVQVAFRLEGICVENKDAIVLPEEPITNETSEQIPFTVGVKVNGLDEATVNCYILPVTTDEALKEELPQPPDVPTFRDQKEVNKELMDKGLYSGTADLK